MHISAIRPLKTMISPRFKGDEDGPTPAEEVETMMKPLVKQAKECLERSVKDNYWNANDMNAHVLGARAILELYMNAGEINRRKR
jgi:hypothetical protein